MLFNFQAKKSNISNWAIVFFIFIIIVSASISEFFQNPTNITHQFKKYKLLIDREKIKSTKKIVFQNHLGTFELNQDKTENPPIWYLTSPRNFPANNELIEQIIVTLEEVNIRQLLIKDPINLSSFSLKDPSIKMNFTLEDNEEISVNIGLINPIDNSTYVTISNKETIYHIDALKMQLEVLGLPDFINSKVFPLYPKDIASLQMYRGEPKPYNSRIQMTQKEENKWFERDRELNIESVNEFFKELASIRSEIILDKMEPATAQKVTNAMKNIQYSFEITKKDKSVITYSISSIVNALPGVKLERGQTFIATASNRKSHYLVNKKYLNIFNRGQYSLREPPPTRSDD